MGSCQSVGIPASRIRVVEQLYHSLFVMVETRFKLDQRIPYTAEQNGE